MERMTASLFVVCLLSFCLFDLCVASKTLYQNFDNVSDESKEEESGEDDCEYSCTEQNGCAVEYTGPVEGTTVTLVRVIISTICISVCLCFMYRAVEYMCSLRAPVSPLLG